MTTTTPIAIPEEMKLSADDPRMRPLWASIAKTSIRSGYLSHYLKISKEVGAPSVDELRESGDLGGTVKWETYVYVNFDGRLTGGGEGVGGIDLADFRTGLQALIELPDDELRNRINVNSHRIEWDR